MNLNIQPSSLWSLLIPLIGGLAVIALRVRSTRKPTTMRKILIPPLGMSTGFLMFVVPQTHIPWLWGLAAFAAGALFFAAPLITTSKMEFVGDDVYLRRSKAFFFIILILLAIRLVLHDFVEQYVTVMQTAALFFLLAFGMLVPWRLAMASKFRRLQRSRASSLQS
ncbi:MULTISPECIES: cytochrome c biogenesis protein CcdC [unclassified Paenibacillus]|uniref:CcdC family protein n=1 Tax=unclassified Paenibacillus TaxID=185978 RepID=UPI00095460C9|nr:MULTISPECIES: cytochrome c biogenesis protein CcdC [unclassified Paenibacillus]ASS67339.1 cytochrome c biogenesis protein CcdC [Paenibacillus sp. RUD330]SIQ80830.1 Membrane protein CcdC involved in cytochrome C biogenesis [Paenibacillus sp. RU4X]SIR02193.1 Membrane protein CcdC involved in cytochrome C biogenesis [Paenibacillus sp. RU4T]